MTNKNSIQFDLTPPDNARLLIICGQHNAHLKTIEAKLKINIKNRGHHFTLIGQKKNIQSAQKIIEYLYELAQTQTNISQDEIHLIMHDCHTEANLNATLKSKLAIHTVKGTIKPRSKNQTTYINNILSHDINFGIGPAGTGKTYLAVACAVQALEQDQVRRIILVRPAVEAGEHLGFLPGDLTQKVDPYLRPLYDALYEMLSFEKVNQLLSKNILEIAPLAYMRGRTLNDSFIILDESQNTTSKQMKMFLTRIGFNSKAVVTGDITQIDLAHGKQSGLTQAMQILQTTTGISFTIFNPKDVVRHPLVQNIIEAYEVYEQHAKN